MEEIKTKKMHTLRLDAQKHLELTGISTVESFNESSVMIKTEGGTLQIAGTGLVVNKFNTEDGCVSVDGLILSIKYAGESEKKQGFFKKLFQ